jgi:RNA polymerase-associated protein CTR9
VDADTTKKEFMAIIRYNMARCQEAQGALQSARKGYEDILVEHPDFVDCLLRLGYMKARRGLRPEAEKLFKQCAELEDGKEEAWTALCISKLHCSHWKEAKVLL